MSRLQRGFCHEEDIHNILTKLEELENKEKEVLLKSNIDVKVNTANTVFFDFSKYKKLKFVFFRKNEEGVRNIEKIFIVRLSDNNVPSVFELDTFYMWIDGAKKYADVRRQTSNNIYAYCDIYRYYIKYSILKKGGNAMKKTNARTRSTLREREREREVFFRR